MKKIILSLILFLGLNATAQIINVSTGIDNSGNSLSQYSSDPNWIITDPSSVTVTALVSDFVSFAWEPTPVTVSNASWINQDGTQFISPSYDGINTYERSFNIPTGAPNFMLNFAIAYDDAFVSLEIVRPDLSVISISVTPTTPYHLSNSITDVVATTGQYGYWKIKAKINHLGGQAGFLLSGTIDIAAPCVEWLTCGNTSTSTEFLGTVNNQPLNIKTNNTQRMIVDATGKVGIGTSTPAQQVHIKDGALLLSGAVAGFGGPQLLFSDNETTHPNGRWGIEYLSAVPSRPSMGGLNFWTPFNPIGPSGTAGNYSLFLKDDGKIGMGATDDSGDANFCASALPNGYRLYVNGGILTTKVKVANYCSTAWADYVFANDYNLKPLLEVESFIKENKHLPNIPSATELEKEGLDLGVMQSLQMAKIEELTLYMIEMKKEIEVLKTQNESLKTQISKN